MLAGRTLTAAIFGLAAHAGAQCQPSWTPFHRSDVDGSVAASLIWDDGAGPALYVAGNFSSAGEAAASNVAKWTGATWSPVGPGLGGPVRALALYDDDGPGPHAATLYAGGAFAGHIARWNGASWTTVGGGTDGPVDALCSYAGELYAGGEFDHAGGSLVARVARWNGTRWSSLTYGVNWQVFALAAHDDGRGPSLFVGGNFSSAGGVTVGRIARWDGSAWSDVGGGVSGAVSSPPAQVLSILSTPGRLYVGGHFTQAGGFWNGASSIAWWDGSHWEWWGGPTDHGLRLWDPPGYSQAGYVRSLALFDPDNAGPLPLTGIAGGYFSHYGTEIGGWPSELPAIGIAAWNVGTFSFPFYPITNAQNINEPTSLWPKINTLLPFRDDPASPARLYAGGEFTKLGTVQLKGLAKWDGVDWKPPRESRGLNDTALASIVYDDDGPGPHAPRLIVGGFFSEAGGQSARGIAAWDGASWSPLGGGVSDGYRPYVNCMTIIEEGAPPRPMLYAGGQFRHAGGVSAPLCARWDGAAWASAGLPAASWNSLYALATFDDDGPGPHPPTLYAAGDLADGDDKLVYRRDGASWTALPGLGNVGFYDSVFALAVFDDDGPGPILPALYAGGLFETPGGPSYIARWNGTSWSSVGSDTNGTVRAMLVHDPDGPGPARPALYAAGEFTVAGVWPAAGIAYWDGADRQRLPGSGLNSGANSLAAFDDTGDGIPALFVGGLFTQADGHPAPGIARFKGTWSPVAPGLITRAGGPTWVFSLSTFNPDGPAPNALYAFGSFDAVGQVSSDRIATWGCAALPCYANCDGSTSPPVLNIQDFVCFLNRFSAGDPWANCDNSTAAPVLNISDFTCFLNRFTAGCP